MHLISGFRARGAGGKLYLCPGVKGGLGEEPPKFIGILHFPISLGPMRGVCRGYMVPGPGVAQNGGPGAKEGKSEISWGLRKCSIHCVNSHLYFV